MTAILHIALGSNRRHGRYGAPAAVLAAAMTALDAAGLAVTARSAVRTTPPLGPRQRRFANAVVAVATGLPLAAVLARLQAIEAAFGRRRGRRWGPRVLDLDLVAAGPAVTPSRHWRRLVRGSTGVHPGAVAAPSRHCRGTVRGLVVPHQGLGRRRFVLDPLAEIAGDWRHPVLHLTARQLRARLRRPRRAHGESP